MFNIAFELEGIKSQEKIELLANSQKYMGMLLLEGKGNTPLTSNAALRGAAMLACTPSLAKIAEGKENTFKVATQVLDNLQDLAYEIERGGMARNPKPDVLGTLSEISVLASIYWSIANGYFDGNSYAVLTNTKRDRSEHNGLRNRVDIIFKQGNSKHLIQVKSSRGISAKSYAPGIKVITPTDLSEARFNKTAHPNKILSYIRTGNSLKLDSVAMRILAIFPTQKNVDI